MLTQYIISVLLLAFALQPKLPTGTISGTVIDAKTHSPLARAMVIAGPTKGVGISTMTNRNGEFILPILPTGRYSVRVGMPGYTTGERIGVVVKPDSVTKVDFALLEDSTGSFYKEFHREDSPEYKIKIVPGDTTYDRAMPRYNPFKDYPLLFDPPPKHAPEQTDSIKKKKE